MSARTRVERPVPFYVMLMKEDTAVRGTSACKLRWSELSRVSSVREYIVTPSETIRLTETLRQSTDSFGTLVDMWGEGEVVWRAEVKELETLW